MFKKTLFSICFVLSVSYSAFCSDFGLGVIVGEPVGLSAKTLISDNTAIDGAVAWSFADETEIHIHADWLRHDWDTLTDAFDVKSGKLPLYYGVGGRIKFEDDSRVGIRFVLGVSYVFEKAPFDIFFEIAPVMDIAPSTELNGNLGLGTRFWF